MERRQCRYIREQKLKTKYSFAKATEYKKNLNTLRGKQWNRNNLPAGQAGNNGEN